MFSVVVVVVVADVYPSTNIALMPTDVDSNDTITTGQVCFKEMIIIIIIMRAMTRQSHSLVVTKMLMMFEEKEESEAVVVV